MRRRLVGAAIAVAALALCAGIPLVVLAGFTGFDIAVSKTHQGNFTVGNNGTFTVTLSASSVQVVGTQTTSISQSFSVTDTLPNGLSYVTAGGPSFTCSNSAQTVTCHGTPTFHQGDTQTLTVVASAASSGTLTNSVSYTAQFPGDTATANNHATDVVTVNAAATTTTTTTSTSTGTVAPTSTIAAPAAGVPPSPGSGSGGFGLILGLLAVVGVLGSALGLSALRRR